MIDKVRKKVIIDKYKMNKNDVGSSPIQVAILTEEINNLSLHIKNNKKDFNAMKNLLFKIKTRTKILKYINKNDFTKYEFLKNSLGIRK